MTDGRFGLIKLPNTMYLKRGLQVSGLTKNPRAACLHEKSSVDLLHSGLWPQDIDSGGKFGLLCCIIKRSLHWLNAQKLIANQLSCVKCPWLWLKNLNLSSTIISVTNAIYNHVFHACALDFEYKNCLEWGGFLSLHRTDIFPTI